MIRKLTILALFLLLFVKGFSQTEVIQVNVKELPLNVVLLQLRDQYNFHFSYGEDQVSKYKITVSKTFESKQEAIEYLLKDLPFRIRIVDEVFIIIPDKKKHKEGEKKQTQIAGQIVEAGSYEPLPFSYILINNHPMIADVGGNFNFITSADTTFHVRISHLGYFVYDTVFAASNFRQFKLVPSSIKLPEVSVQKTDVEKASMVGEKIAKITLNTNISHFLPGQGDNSVFNHIRLMPGIQAAGEQSTDLLIWGSYEGQSLYTFDQFTLFGLKNYNDNINVVNPFVVKTIEILKGGFEAKYGNRVGGIVNIIGKNGNIQNPVFSFNINPTTLNGMVEAPLKKKSSLLIAYRQTYYNLYNSGDFNIFAPTHKQPKNQQFQLIPLSQKIDLSVYPDNYRFRDMNLKFSRSFDNGDQFYISTYGGGDYFHLAANGNVKRSIGKTPNVKEIASLDVSVLTEEENRQYGASAFYNHKWRNEWVSKFIITQSDFKRSVSDETQTSNSNSSVIYKKDKSKTDNTANESSIRIENLAYFTGGHQLEFGGGFYYNSAKIDYFNNINDTLSIQNPNRFSNSRFYSFAEDNLPLGNKLTLKWGARINISTNNAKIYFEPRINASYKFSDYLKFSASWGRFHQFISKIASVDRDQNYTYLWSVANKDVPVVSATHWISEFNYSKNDFTINVEGYFKTMHHITKRVFEERSEGPTRENGYFSYFGNAKTFGLDLFVKRDFGKHSIWASYTLSKALERLAPQNSPLPEYTLAPHHQLHEFKAAGILNVGKIYFSADYVYGSGMEILRKVFGSSTSDLSYKRVDAAITYKFTPRRFSGEFGLSVMNFFDTQNLRYNNLKNIQLPPELGDIRVYSDAARFTPTIFLKLVF